MRRALLHCAWLCLAATAHADGAPDATRRSAASFDGRAAAKLAVIVDDLGYNLERGRRVIALPGPITVAVLPFAPHTTQLSRMAGAAGAAVLLHEPMQANEPNPEPHTLTASMSDAALHDALDRALADVPEAIGVSNHTGSVLTALRAPMRSVMRDLYAHGLFFVDSRTTAATVACDVAAENGVAVTQRDVFLDHVATPDAIAHEFERAVAIARRRGHAVLIAHPYDASLAFLEAMLPTLAGRGVEQVPVTALVNVSRAAVPVRDRVAASPRTAPAL